MAMNPESVAADDDLEHLQRLGIRMRDPAGGVDVRDRKWLLKKVEKDKRRERRVML